MAVPPPPSWWRSREAWLKRTHCPGAEFIASSINETTATSITINNEETIRKMYEENLKIDMRCEIFFMSKFMEDNKAKIFTNNEIAESLGISLGTVSNITNRLESIGDIKIVRIRQKTSALSQVFQHIDGPLPAYTKERGKRDAILNVLDRFRQNPDEVFTKDELVKYLL